MEYLLDMDGVIVDFVGGCSSTFGVPASKFTSDDLPSATGLPREVFWTTIEKQGPEWWENLKPYPWMDQLVRTLGGVGNFVIATSPIRDGGCAEGKIRWLKRYFGPTFRDYMIGPHKHLMAKSGLTLIDDRDKNVTKFREAGGRALLFPRPWNTAHHSTPEEFLDYASEALTAYGKI